MLDDDDDAINNSSFSSMFFNILNNCTSIFYTLFLYFEHIFDHWKIRFNEREKIIPTEYVTIYVPYLAEGCGIFDRIDHTCYV